MDSSVKLKRQSEVLAALEFETRVFMRKMEEDNAKALQLVWDKAKEGLRAAILAEYHKDFGNKPWNLTTARQRGTIIRIERKTKQLMDAFVAGSLEFVKQARQQVWSEEVLRSMWILDQTTPPKVKVLAPRPRRFTESDRGVSIQTGPMAKITWQDRWASWGDAYHSTLNQNIALGALNESTPMEAADEVEASRPGSPSYTVGDVFDRIMRTLIIEAEVQARDDVKGANEDAVLSEVWQTMEDGRVCAICDSQDGLERSEVTEDMPAHPICRCFFRLVPKSWAELAASNDPSFARMIDRAGLVPDAMLIMGDDGEPKAAATVSFQKWREGMAQGVGAR